MPTQSQIDANCENAKLSTGPITEAGKSSSARNSQTHGLFTREPHVESDEQDLYAEFSDSLYIELGPAGLLEDALANEIVGATWRLRQCASADAEIHGFDETADKTRRSIERARAAANCALHRSLNRLGKLQTERVIRQQTQLGDLSHVPLADSRNLMDAHYRFDRAVQQAGNTGTANAESLLDEIVNSPLPPLSGPAPEGASKEKSASFCKTAGAKAAEDLLAAFKARQENQNLPCTCRFGRTYAQCCGNEGIDGLDGLENAA